MSLTLTVLCLIALIVVWKTAVVIPARESGIKERLGKFAGVLNPGLHFLVPFFDKVAYRHEMREQVIEVPPQVCISRDNIQIDVDGIVYLKVMDPPLASYGIENYRVAAINLAQTTLRSELGKLELHETFSERDRLNQTVVEEIDKASAPWGVKVLRYEVMNITPTPGVVQTLEKAMEAERDRRAEVTLATAEKEAVSKVSEGKRQEAINLSEGEKQKRINEAEGMAQQIAILAEATAYGTRKVAEAISTLGGKEAVEMRIVEHYIHEFGKVAAKSDLTVVPLQLANIQGVFEGLSKVTEPFAPGVRSPSPR